MGNAAFCADYDSRLRDVSFRVVNGLDVVARYCGLVVVLEVVVVDLECRFIVYVSFDDRY